MFVTFLRRFYEKINNLFNSLQVNVEKLHETLEERKAKKYLKPSTIEFEPKHKMKGKSGTVKRFHIKRTVQEERKWVSCFFSHEVCIFKISMKTISNRKRNLAK